MDSKYGLRRRAAVYFIQDTACDTTRSRNTNDYSSQSGVEGKVIDEVSVKSGGGVHEAFNSVRTNIFFAVGAIKFKKTKILLNLTPSQQRYEYRQLVQRW
jgi:hypothetical protein